VALLALRLSARLPTRAPGRPPERHSVAALINAGWLLLLELLVAVSAADRLLTRTPQVDGLAVLIVSGIAALVMAVGALVLRGDGDDGGGERDLSVAAVLLDTIAMRARQRAWPSLAGSSWLPAAGTGWTPRWH
jgi:Co/Zn/Cd efflux system component